MLDRNNVSLCCCIQTVGTGTNACYMEDTAKIKKWNDDSAKQVIIVALLLQK